MHCPVSARALRANSDLPLSGMAANHSHGHAAMTIVCEPITERGGASGGQPTSRSVVVVEGG
jgi:hypothetical protein